MVANSSGDLFGLTQGETDSTLFEITGAAFIFAPTIEGTRANQVAAIGTPTTPFSGVSLSDPTSGATETLTIALTGASGSLVDGAGFDGLESAGDNAYVLSGSASAVNAELDALVFTLAGAGATRLTLTDVSSTYATETDATTTVVDAESVGAISASAAYVSANFAGFEEDALLTAIDLTDAGIPALSLTAAEASGDGETLGKITNSLFEVIAPSPALPAYYAGGNGAGGIAIALSASHSVVNLYANSRLDLAGSDDSVTLGASSNISLDASDDAVQASTDDGIWLLAGTGDTVTGSGFTLYAAGGTEFTVGGNGAGGPDIYTQGFGMGVGLKANSRMDMIGSNDNVTMGAASNLGLYGSDDTISATTRDTIWLLAGTGDTVTGSNFTIYAAAGSEFTVGGNGAYGPMDYVRRLRARIGGSLEFVRLPDGIERQRLDGRELQHGFHRLGRYDHDGRQRQRLAAGRNGRHDPWNGPRHRRIQFHQPDGWRQRHRWRG